MAEQKPTGIGRHVRAFFRPRAGEDPALRQFRTMVVWIAAIGVLMVGGALWYLSLFGELNIHMIVATVLGVFLSVLLGCGLFALAFFSDKSGHDDDVTNATRDTGRDAEKDH